MQVVGGRGGGGFWGGQLRATLALAERGCHYGDVIEWMVAGDCKIVEVRVGICGEDTW